MDNIKKEYDTRIKLYDDSNMFKSFEEQADGIKKTLEENTEIIDEVAMLVNKCEKIIVICDGTENLIPKYSKYLWNAYMKKPFLTISSRIFNDYTPEYVSQESCVIIISSSGKGEEIIKSLKKCMDKKSRIIVITNSVKREKDSVFILDDYKSGFILNTESGESGTFNASVSLLNYLIIKCIEKKGISVSDLLKVLKSEIPRNMELLSKSEELKKWASHTAKKIIEINPSNTYFIGNGPRSIMCEKSVLMFMNTCRMNCSSIRAQDFENSIISTLDEVNEDKSLLIMLNPRPSHVKEEIFEEYEEIKNLWKKYAGEEKVIEVNPFEYCDYHSIGFKSDVLTSLFYNVMINWLAYFIALEKEINPGFSEILEEIRKK